MGAAAPLEHSLAPEKWIDRLIHSPVGDLIARPWVDPVGLAALKRWYFPLSRLWAAANAANGSVEAFRDAIGDAAPAYGRWSRRYVEGALARHGEARRVAIDARRVWEQAAFGGDAVAPAAMAALDDERRRRASLHLATRGQFYPLLFAARPPLARWNLPTTPDVESAYGAVVGSPARAYAVPSALPAVEVSRAASRPGLTETWLRFATPHPRLAAMPGSDVVYARVVEPVGGGGLPTLILGGGLCVEADLLTRSIDAASLVARAGFRVVDLVSPFHGLRCLPGSYGGEPFFATAPLGVLDLIVGQTVETATLVAWCRARFGGPVAVGGISMTSFVAQQAAVRCGDWPAEARPDAILLVSHSGRIEEVTFRGTLVRALGLNERLDAAGWSREGLMRWEGLLNPKGAPTVPSDRIVSVLGRGDKLLPFVTGQELARDWNLPVDNVFELRVGHLAMAVAMMRDDRPLRRLKEILGA